MRLIARTENQSAVGWRIVIGHHAARRRVNRRRWNERLLLLLLLLLVVVVIVAVLTGSSDGRLHLACTRSGRRRRKVYARHFQRHRYQMMQRARAKNQMHKCAIYNKERERKTWSRFVVGYRENWRNKNNKRLRYGWRRALATLHKTRTVSGGAARSAANFFLHGSAVDLFLIPHTPHTRKMYRHTHTQSQLNPMVEKDETKEWRK